MNAFCEAFAAYCALGAEIDAALLIGSQARADHPADRYSDADILIFSRAEEKLLYSDGWLEALGKPRVSFTEKTFCGATERRVLFEDGQDVDFIILPSRLAASPEDFAFILARGYLLLKDDIGLEAALLKTEIPVPSAPLPDRAEFENLVSNFAFHTVWTAKKLARGELWAARQCLEGYMRGLLLKLEEWKRACAGEDVWHSGRFLEEWADGDFTAALPGIYAGAGRDEAAAALENITELFARTAARAAELLGFDTDCGRILFARDLSEKILKGSGG